MTKNNLPAVTKFNPILIYLHWLMALLIIAVYVCMEFSDFFPKDSDPRKLMKNMHYMLGISVLLLVSVRLIVRLSTKIPAIIPELKTNEKRLANIMHVALYIFMFAMPLLGWLILSVHGKSVPFFGLELPPLMGENENLHDVFHELHETGATIGYFLLGGHAAMALFHHYIKKDNTLLRMSFLKK